MNSFLQKYFNKRQKKKIRIIHADDHSLFRYGARMALSKRDDIEIIGEAANGLELLKLLETTVPNIIILNIAMPVMDGIETLPRIKEKYPDSKVIVLSMHNDTRMIIKMMRLGANSYLTKSADCDLICKAIRSVHEYGSYYSEAIERALLESNVNTEKQSQELSDKELQILEFQKQNKSVSEIAGILGITERTVSAIMDKLEKKMNL